MSFRKASIRRTLGILFFLFLIVSAGNAQRHQRRDNTDFRRFSILMAGGVGFSENHHVMVDLKSELQFGLTSKIRLGLGLGYLNNGRARDNQRAEMMKDKNFRIIPVSLNFYYFVPFSRKWNLYMSGGGSYNLGSFNNEIFHKRKNAFGAQTGLGCEFRAARRILIVFEGSYRFVDFKRLNWPLSVNPKDIVREEKKKSKDMARLNFDKNDQCLYQIYEDQKELNKMIKHISRPSSFNLNGFCFRAGLKFSL